MNTSHRIVVVGGGAAGVFAAITCAEAAPGAEVIVLEKSPQFLTKVRISGGGRCNITHACFDPREFARHYPRGEQALIGAFQRFQASDTVEWFESRGVKLKAERDGRMFPVTDSSETIVECLLSAAKGAGVKLQNNCDVKSVVKRADGRFELRLSSPGRDAILDVNPVHEPGLSSQGFKASNDSSPIPEPCESSGTQAQIHGEKSPNPNERFEPLDRVEAPFGVPALAGSACLAGPLRNRLKPGLQTGEVHAEGAVISGEHLRCDRFLLATGGCRTAALGQIPVSLGHTLEPPVPSLFTVTIESPWLRSLAGVAVDAEVSVPGTGLSERGPVLVTHWGLSGPAILRVSAWGARKLHALDYQFPLHVNWLPSFTSEAITRELQGKRASAGTRLVVNTPFAPLTARLWEALVLAADIPRETRWASLSRTQQQRLAQQLTRTELTVIGKSLNKDEFVTCGGVRLGEVSFKTMESRVCPGLHFAGELLDIDGLTGGFNFQAAWTTGWIAGRAMAAD